MKAWVLDSIGKIELKEVDKPSMAKNEVLVKVRAAGICGSDIPRIYTNGAHKMPLILGHEFSGEIVDYNLEDNSDGFKIGDRVGIFPLIPCKECGPCLQKKYEMCKKYSYLGSRTNGGFSEYVTVPKWNLLKIPDKVTFEQAAMLEPMAVSVHAMKRIVADEDVVTDKTVLVYGAGTIGLLLTMFLKDRGFDKIFVVGNKDFQRKTLEKIGIDAFHYIDSRTEDVKSQVLLKTLDNGIDYSFECIGKNESVSDVVDMAAPGGKICLVGNPYSDMVLSKNTYWKILRLQLMVTGTWNSSYLNENDSFGYEVDDWKYVIDRLSRGMINPEMIITHRLSIEELGIGFDIMANKSENFAKIMMCQKDY